MLRLANPVGGLGDRSRVASDEFSRNGRGNAAPRPARAVARLVRPTSRSSTSDDDSVDPWTHARSGEDGRKRDLGQKPEAMVPSLWISRRPSDFNPSITPKATARIGFYPLAFARIPATLGSKTRGLALARHPEIVPGCNLAQYKYLFYLASSPNPRFDHNSAGGVSAPHAGIYRCQACGREVVADKGEKLPGQDHHKHQDARDPIRWRLAVAAQA